LERQRNFPAIGAGVSHAQHAGSPWLQTDGRWTVNGHLPSFGDIKLHAFIERRVAAVDQRPSDRSVSVCRGRRAAVKADLKPSFFSDKHRDVITTFEPVSSQHHGERGLGVGGEGRWEHNVAPDHLEITHRHGVWSFA
jgi:hypothetical protein